MQAYNVLDDILILSNYLKNLQIPDYQRWYELTVAEMLQNTACLSPELSSELYIGDLQRQNFHQAVLTVFEKQVDQLLAMIKKRDPKNFNIWYKSNLAEQLCFAKDIYASKNYTDALAHFDAIRQLLVDKSTQYVSIKDADEDSFRITLLQPELNVPHNCSSKSTLPSQQGHQYQLTTKQNMGWFSYAWAKCYNLFFFTALIENKPCDSPTLDNQTDDCSTQAESSERIISSLDNTKKQNS